MEAKVRDLMTPGAIGVDYHQSIGEAARTMRDWGVGSVLVVSDRTLCGLVTDRDLVVRAVAESKGPDAPVGPLSSSDLVGVNADDDAAVAVRLMREHAVRRLPSPAPVSLAADESASTAAQAMKEHGIGTVLVVTAGRLSGLVTDRDIAIRVLAEDRDPRTTRVGDIASSDLAVLGPDDDVDQAIRLVCERAVRRIPVVQDGAPVGVVSIGDLALKKDQGSALSDVSAAPPNN